jgi:hypothetical protein
MLMLLSGGMYLDMIWYGVSLSSIPSLFWQTICGFVVEIRKPAAEELN